MPSPPVLAVGSFIKPGKSRLLRIFRFIQPGKSCPLRTFRFIQRGKSRPLRIFRFIKPGNSRPLRIFRASTTRAQLHILPQTFLAAHTFRRDDHVLERAGDAHSVVGEEADVHAQTRWEREVKRAVLPSVRRERQIFGLGLVHKKAIPVQSDLLHAGVRVPLPARPLLLVRVGVPSGHLLGIGEGAGVWGNKFAL